MTNGSDGMFEVSPPKHFKTKLDTTRNQIKKL
jgi:hypothetical protein